MGATVTALQQQFGSADVDTWTRVPADDEIRFQQIIASMAPIEWQNRPTFQQVVQLTSRGVAGAESDSGGGGGVLTIVLAGVVGIAVAAAALWWVQRRLRAVSRPGRPRDRQDSMRIATWNVNSLKARQERVEEWLGYARPDVLCLQETKLSDKSFPQLSFSALGYDSVHHGQGQWNGVAILSRVGIDDVTSGFGELTDPYEGDARMLAATCGGVRVVSVYVPNGREVGTEFYDRKLAVAPQSARLAGRDRRPLG